MKRFLSFFLAIFLFFSSFFSSYRHVSANAAAFTIAGMSAEMLPAAAGASVVAPYVIAGVILAAGGVYVANQYGDQIRDYASRVYSSMSAVAKQSFQTAYAEAVQSGKNTITLTSDFLSELQLKSQAIADFLKSTLNTAESSSLSATAWSLDLASYSYGWKFTANQSTGYLLYVSGQQAKSVNYTRNTDYSPPLVNVWWYDFSGRRYDVVSSQTSDSFFRYKEYYNSLSKVMELFAYVGISVGIVKSTLESSKHDVKTAVDNVLDDIVSRPIGIPNLGVKSYDNQSLTWDSAQQKWKTGTGTVVQEVVPDFPMPAPRSDATWSSPAIPIDQLVVGDVPFVGISDVPVGEGLPSKFPDTEANRWKQLVTTKFPFSLPFDVYSVLSALNADPQRPVLKLDVTSRIGGVAVPFKFSQSIEFIEPYMPFFRTFLLIGYVLFLIFSTRKLLGGGQ